MGCFLKGTASKSTAYDRNLRIDRQCVEGDPAVVTRETAAERGMAGSPLVINGILWRLRTDALCVAQGQTRIFNTGQGVQITSAASTVPISGPW